MNREISYTGRLYLMLPKRRNITPYGRGYGHVTVAQVCQQQLRYRYSFALYRKAMQAGYTCIAN